MTIFAIIAASAPGPGAALQHSGNLAVGLMLAGILLLYVEFNVPGKVLPGCLGLLLLLDGLFRLSQLPLRTSAVAVCCAGLALVLFELRFPRRGLFAGPGTLLLAASLARLALGRSAISPGIAISAAATLGLTTAWLGYVAGLARRNKFVPGPAGMRGKLAFAWGPLPPGPSEPQAKVEIAGELWPAALEPGAAAVAPGAAVVVSSVLGSRTLLVRPAVPAASRPRRHPQSGRTR